MNSFVNTAVPQLFIKDGLKALDYYKKLGMKATNVVKTFDGRDLAHANLHYADCIFYLNGSSTTSGGLSLMVSSDEKNMKKVINLFKKLAMNGKIVYPIERTARNHLYGSLIDKFGISWQIRSFVENISILNLYPLHLPQLLEMGFTSIGQVMDKDEYHIPKFIEKHESIFGVKKINLSILKNKKTSKQEYDYCVMDNFDKPKEKEVVSKYAKKVIYSDYGWSKHGFFEFNFIDNGNYKWKYGFDAFKQWEFLINNLIKQKLLNKDLVLKLFNTKKNEFKNNLVVLKNELSNLKNKNVIFIAKLKGLNKISSESSGWTIISPGLIPWFYSTLNINFPASLSNTKLNYDRYGINNTKNVNIFEQFKQSSDIVILCSDNKNDLKDSKLKLLLKDEGKLHFLDLQDFMVPCKSALGLVIAVKNVIKILNHE